MAISGTEKSLTYALAGVMRAGATRVGCHSPKVFIQVAGVERGWNRATDTAEIESTSLSITDTRGETATTASFIARGWTPTCGMVVFMRFGSVNNRERLVAGRITRVVQRTVGMPGSEEFTVTCNDYTPALNKRKVSGHYTGSATTIVQALISTYATGYTSTNVEAGMATVAGGITFTDQDLTDCISQTMKRAGGSWYCDYYQDVHAWVTADPALITNPVTLTTGLATLSNPVVTRDTSQQINRVFVEGGGGSALSGCAVGETILPVNAPEWYSATGGVVKSGPQRITYTGVATGGGGGLVGPGASPSSAPLLALASGAGQESGVHGHAVTFVTAAGESIPSPTATITVGPITAPATAPTVGTPTTGGSVTAGAHDYELTFLGGGGETTPSPVSGSATTVVVTDPASITNPARLSGSGLASGTYTYKVVFEKGGLLTLPSPASGSWTSIVSNRCARLPRSGLPSPPAGWNLLFYRSMDGGAWKQMLGPSDGFPSDDIDYYYDGLNSQTVGADAPSVSTALIQTVPLTNLQLGGPGTTSRGLYRRFNGTGTFKLVEALNNAVTSYSDTVANASLGAAAPSSNTSAMNQTTVSLPIGPTDTTGRNHYRTVAGGSQLKLESTTSDNTTTSLTDSTADASLSATTAPTSDTSGLTQPTGQVVAGSTSIIVAGTGGFVSGGGWAVIGNGQQVIRYTGKSGTALTGVPATGDGAIMATISYNSTITAAPQLTGIPASGTGAILYAILKGDDVNIFVQRDDVAAQDALEALMNDVNDDGIREDYIQDRRLAQAECEARGDAQLALRKDPDVSLTYTSKDKNTRAGRQIVAALVAPTSISETLAIQQVTISNFTPNLFPDYAVVAASDLYTFEDLLRQTRQG